MARVMTSEATGAAIYVLSDDHCPPHVHARHRGDGWIARVRFSFIDSGVEFMSIAPLKRPPSQRVVSRLVVDISAELTACRRHWWEVRRTTCLENGRLGRERIRAAADQPAQGCLDVTLHDGTMVSLDVRP